jgi:hypothetical protein
MSVKRKDNTEKIRVAIPRGAGVGLRQAAEEIAGIARANCPVSDNNEPGHVHTRDTIIARGVNGSRTDVVVGGAGSLIEFGTSRMGARPFLLPAAESVRARLASIVGDSIKDELR